MHRDEIGQVDLSSSQRCVSRWCRRETIEDKREAVAEPTMHARNTTSSQEPKQECYKDANGLQLCVWSQSQKNNVTDVHDEKGMPYLRITR